MIIAYPYSNNLWRLQSNQSSNEIYNRKEEIKKAGGKYNGKLWLMEESLLHLVGAQKMILIRFEAYCHTESGTMWVTEEQFKAGSLKNPFCSTCGSRANQDVEFKILKK